MTILLIFFALPIATIIVSIALQKIFRNPLLVAAIIFSIFLVVTFIIGDLNLLIATIAYTIIAYITAFITMLIKRIIRELNRNRRKHRENEEDDEDDNDDDNDNGNNTVSVISDDPNRLDVGSEVFSNNMTGGRSRAYRRNCWRR